MPLSGHLRRTLPTLAIASALASPRYTSAQKAAVPFTVGEELVYRATIGAAAAGTAKMTVVGIDTVRGRAAYHVVFTIDGGIPMFRVRDRYDSWIDVKTLSSLRHVQQISEAWYQRNTTFEIFPDRLQYQKNQEPVLPTVANPLDDLSFIYATRISGITVGETRSVDRYFQPDRNPVVVTGLSTDTVTVGAGTFTTTAAQPMIKTSGLFAESTDARIWFSADSNRYPVRVRTKFSMFTITLSLESITRP